MLMILAAWIELPAGEMPRPIITDPVQRAALTKVLDSIARWSIEVEVGSGELKIPDRRRTSIFVNSNLARVLLAAYEISDEPLYRDQAIAWFDRLVALQQPAMATTGDTVGYWGDLSPAGNIYLGDAGTSATALAGAIRFVDESRRQRYLAALERYAGFVRFGCATDPQNKNRGGSPGWIIEAGADQGAIGAGYYRGQLSLAPYTISTSVSGAGFFSALAQLTGQPAYHNIAAAAGIWLMNQRRPDGYMPYVLHRFALDDWPINTMSYVSDGLIGLYRRSEDESLKTRIAKSITRNIQWLLNHQNEDGTWGGLRSEDQQRSQGALSLLILYYSEISAEQTVLDAIWENCSYFLNGKNVRRFGVRELPVSTGFVGLGIAEALQPGITYRVR